MRVISFPLQKGDLRDGWKRLPPGFPFVDLGSCQAFIPGGQVAEGMAGDAVAAFGRRRMISRDLTKMLLPAPFGPSSPNTQPCGTVSEMPASASKPPLLPLRHRTEAQEAESGALRSLEVSAPHDFPCPGGGEGNLVTVASPREGMGLAYLHASFTANFWTCAGKQGYPQNLIMRLLHFVWIAALAGGCERREAGQEKLSPAVEEILAEAGKETLAEGQTPGTPNHLLPEFYIRESAEEFREGFLTGTGVYVAAPPSQGATTPKPFTTSQWTLADGRHCEMAVNFAGDDGTNDLYDFTIKLTAGSDIETHQVRISYAGAAVEAFKSGNLRVGMHPSKTIYKVTQGSPDKAR